MKLLNLHVKKQHIRANLHAWQVTRSLYSFIIICKITTKLDNRQLPAINSASMPLRVKVNWAYLGTVPRAHRIYPGAWCLANVLSKYPAKIVSIVKSALKGGFCDASVGQ